MALTDGGQNLGWRPAAAQAARTEPSSDRSRLMHRRPCSGVAVKANRKCSGADPAAERRSPPATSSDRADPGPPVAAQDSRDPPGDRGPPAVAGLPATRLRAELNPVEKVWSTMKGSLAHLAARTAGELAAAQRRQADATATACSMLRRGSQRVV